MATAHLAVAVAMTVVVAVVGGRAAGGGACGASAVGGGVGVTVAGDDMHLYSVAVRRLCGLRDLALRGRLEVEVH